MTTAQAENQSRLKEETKGIDSILDLGIERAATYLSPAFFGCLASEGNWKLWNYIELLDRAIRQLLADDFDVLCLSLPPQHGKTLFCSRYLPAWYLGRHPDRNVIVATYGQQLADESGGFAREVLRRYGPAVFGVGVSDDYESKSRWKVAAIDGRPGELTASGRRRRRIDGGMMYSVGFDGPLTGRGGHLIIVDDPYKDQREAASQVVRKSRWNWFEAVAMTRKRPGTKVIVLHTRWHEEDMIGQIMRDWPEKFRLRYLNIPAVSKGEGDPLGRPESAPLSPIYSSEFYAEQKSSLSSYLYSALYDGSPQPERGEYFTRGRFRYFRDAGQHVELLLPDGQTRRLLKSEMLWFQTCDTAMKEGQDNDYTVVGTFGVTATKDLLVYDVFRERLEIPKQMDALSNERARYSGRDDGANVTYQAVEDKASGTGLIQEGRRRGRPFRVLTADASKTRRAMPVAVMYENGMVYHHAGAHWLGDFEDEILAFPRGGHDDQVDMLSYAGMEVRRGGGGGAAGVVERSPGAKRAAEKSSTNGNGNGNGTTSEEKSEGEARPDHTFVARSRRSGVGRAFA